MKKIAGYLSLGALAMCLCVFNISRQNNKEDLALNTSNGLLNLKAVQASATEYYCDATNTRICIIDTPDGQGFGTGEAKISQ